MGALLTLFAGGRTVLEALTAPVIATDTTPVVEGCVFTVTPGTYNAAAVLTYQWTRDGEAIVGATSSTYTAVSADGQAEIAVVETATFGSQVPITQTSNAIEVWTPAELSPTWVINPQIDITALGDGDPVASWAGTGITFAQATGGSRPVLEAATNSVRFDGSDDWLQAAVSGAFATALNAAPFTLVLYVRLDSGVGNNDCLCGGGFDLGRALEIIWQTGNNLAVYDSGGVVPVIAGGALPGNANFRCLVLRFLTASHVAHFDGVKVTSATNPRLDTGGGTFYLGTRGWSPGSACPPMAIRYGAFFPSDIGEEGAANMLAWLGKRP